MRLPNDPFKRGTSCASLFCALKIHEAESQENIGTASGPTCLVGTIQMPEEVAKLQVNEDPATRTHLWA